MKPLVRPVVAGIVGLLLGLVLAWVAGENPWTVVQILGKSAFGSPYDLGMTLFYASPLILTGLSVSWAFQAGLFNIGAEGQLNMGALCCAMVGAWWPGLSAPYSWVVGIAAAFLGGAIWGWIPGFLKAKQGNHEVINTIMLNFVAAGLTSFVSLYVIKNPNSQNPETVPLGSSWMLKPFEIFDGAPVGVGLLLAVGLAFFLDFWLRRSVSGHELRWTGASSAVARTAGVQVKSKQLYAMTLAGGLAGLVGVVEILGNAGRYRFGFSADYGYIGIAVALLARARPAGVVFSALLFGALHKGAGDLDIETEFVTRDLASIIQALVLICVSAQFWKGRKSSG